MLRHLTDDGKMKKPKAPKETPEEEWCAVCKVTITTGLKQHVLSHVSVEVTHFHFPFFFPLLITLSLSPQNPQCPICGQKFRWPAKFYLHMKARHTIRDVVDFEPPQEEEPEQEEQQQPPQPPPPVEMKQCPICKEETGDLLNHLINVHTTRDQTECPVCKKPFAFLKRHLILHADMRQFPCGFCDISYTQESHRLTHWETKHLSKPADEDPRTAYPTECPVCKKLFRSHERLHIHFVEHTTEKPYVCGYCQFDSPYKRYVLGHIRRLHPQKKWHGEVSMKEDSIFKGPRPWETMGYFDVKDGGTQRDPMARVCKVCNKEFRCRALLVRHSLIHTGEKPFQCLYCGAVFTHREKALEHVRNMHQGKSVEKGVAMREDTQYAKMKKRPLSKVMQGVERFKATVGLQ